MKAFLAILCIAVAHANIIPDVHHAQPFKFGYSVKDHHGEQHRQEASNGAGGVVGSYGFTDDRGIARQVDYVADHAGFRAAVKTNEPGTANQSPAAVHMVSSEPYVHGSAVPYVGSPALAMGHSLAPVYGHHGAYAHNGLYAHDGVYGHQGVYGHDGVYGHNGVYGHDGVYGLGARHGLGYGGYGLGGALGYSGLLGGGYRGVNYGAPLVGGAIRGFDSRFA